jgi:hypothetical protein
MNSFDSLINNNLGWVHENKYVLPVLSLFLGLYAALARPKLPKFVEKLFENPVFRLVIISYIIYRGNKDPQLALMIAAAFLMTIHMINKHSVIKLENKCKLSKSLIKENMAAQKQTRAAKKAAAPVAKAAAPAAKAAAKAAAPAAKAAAKAAAPAAKAAAPAAKAVVKANIPKPNPPAKGSGTPAPTPKK